MIKRIIASFIILTFVGSFSFADEVKTATIQKTDISFEQAYELMLANNNELKQIFEEIKEKKYRKNAAVGHYFPKVGIQSTYLQFDNPINVGLGPLGTLTLQDKQLWYGAAGVTWNIFTGGKIVALNSAARAKLEATNEKYKEVTNRLISELVKRYYGLTLANDVVTVRKQVMETTKKHLDDAIKLEKAGIISKSERLHADVAYEQAQREYLAAIRDRNVVEEGLKVLIKADNVELKDVEVNPKSNLFMYKSDLAKLEEFKEIALKNNPQLKQLNAKKKAVQANYRANVANYMPTVSVFAYDIFTSKNQSYQIPHWAIGGSANWLLFDGLTRENELRAANSMRKQVQYETINAQNNIECLVAKNYQELMKYKEQYESTDKSIESAKEALRTANLAFKEGLGTSLAVTDAQTALSGVKIERLNAIYNYDKTLVELLSTNGSAEEILNYIKNSEKEKL